MSIFGYIGKLMTWIIGIIIATVATILSRGKRPPRGTSSLTDSYTPKLWEGVMLPFAQAAGVPILYASDWLREESDGNPCAIGDPGAVGPDGNPREMGIAQWFNPDDLKALKLTGTQLRAYCNPKKIQVKNKRGQLVWSHSQEVIRPLTPQEMQVQAKATIDKIVEARGIAAHYIAAAGVKWPSDGFDFYALIKLVHALPGLVHALVNVAHSLGHPPGSFKEFRQAIELGGVTTDEKTEGYRSEFSSLFDNAERAAARVPGRLVA